MDLISFGKIISDETSTIQFLESKNTQKDTCPFCKSKKIYTMKNKSRFRCKICKKDFRPFYHSKFQLVKISHSKWIALIKCFELSVSAKVAAEQTQTSYKTALKVFDVIRYCILEEIGKTDDVLRGETEADEAYFGGKRKGNRGRGAKNKTIVFGILERKGKVSVEIVNDVSAKTLLAGTVKKVKRGSIVYTDKWRGYNSLMFSGYNHMSVDHNTRFANGKVYINGIEGFWSFAKENMAKHHGISSAKFLLYIKEMEWRYNNRTGDLFDLIINYMLGALNP